MPTLSPISDAGIYALMHADGFEEKIYLNKKEIAFGKAKMLYEVKSGDVLLLVYQGEKIHEEEEIDIDDKKSI